MNGFLGAYRCQSTRLSSLPRCQRKRVLSVRQVSIAWRATIRDPGLRTYRSLSEFRCEDANAYSQCDWLRGSLSHQRQLRHRQLLESAAPGAQKFAGVHLFARLHLDYSRILCNKHEANAHSRRDWLQYILLPSAQALIRFSRPRRLERDALVTFFAPTTQLANRINPYSK